MLPAQQTPDRLKFLVEIDVNYGAQIMKKYESKVVELKQQQKDDVKQKDFCVAEFNENEADGARSGHHVGPDHRD